MHNRGIAFVYVQGPQSTEVQIVRLLEAMKTARAQTRLPISIAADESVASRFRSSADHVNIASRTQTAEELRINMSCWVPFDEWLYLDGDVQIVGPDFGFGFGVLQRGFEFAVCSIACEADKSCAGDSATFQDLKRLRPDIPYYAFYPQLGVYYQRRCVAMQAFAAHWWQIHLQLSQYMDRLQPSFSVAYHDVGHLLRLYVLPPHFNCRRGFREVRGGLELPTSLFPREQVQMRHDRIWYAPDDG